VRGVVGEKFVDYYDGCFYFADQTGPVAATQTAGKWAQVPLETWTYKCLFCVHVVLFVGSGLAAG
jgi:hypothetical protein